MADHEIDFGVPAELSKWASLNNERMPNAFGPYLVSVLKRTNFRLPQQRYTISGAGLAHVISTFFSLTLYRLGFCRLVRTGVSGSARWCTVWGCDGDWLWRASTVALKEAAN
jgi:hypothetical protein